MQPDIKERIIGEISPSLNNLEHTFNELLNTGRLIEKTLEKDGELLIELRRFFDNLSAAVELEFEGTSVFEQEIAKTREIIENSLDWVRKSSEITNSIGDELQNVWQAFDIIHTQGVQLSETIKKINLVADSIEVASRNAGITAYHAGRDGRGFEVIAKEMTTLVRSVQNPTKVIPEISDDVIKDIIDLSHQLLKIGNYIHEFNAINEKFANITSDFMGLIPEVESELKNILESVETQRKLHQDLIQENEKSLQWRDDLFNILRMQAISEISFEVSYRAVDIEKSTLYKIEDRENFAIIFQSLQIALDDLINQYHLALKDAKMVEDVKAKTQAAERCILMLVTEASNLFQLVNKTAGEVHKWLKTNAQATEFIKQGVELYNKVNSIIAGIKDQIQEIRSVANSIDQPLDELKRITERSRLLGLYAGIESARGSSYAPALGFVTEEIKSLADQSSTFVKTMGKISKEMFVNFTNLSRIIDGTIVDINSGINALQSAITYLNENRSVLNNLDKLAGEMKESTKKINDYCTDINDLMRQLNHDYEKINDEFIEYHRLAEQNIDFANQSRERSDVFRKEIGIVSKTGKILNYRQSIEPVMLDPAYKTDARSHEIIEQIFNGLLTFDSANNLVPGIAERFTVSSDGLKWDFVIRDNAKFHDGRTVSVEDIVATFQRVRQSPNSFFIDYVESIEAVDRDRVRFVLSYPYLPFLANLACGVCDITQAGFNPEKPIGSGPFRFVQWNKGKHIELECHPDFIFGCVAIERINLYIITSEKEASERFHAGEIDITPVTPESISLYTGDEIVKGSTLATQYLNINVKADTPFRDRRVRQAMNHAIDKQFFVDNQMKGQAIPARGIFPPGLYAYNKDLKGYDYDMQMARALMREAGYGGGIAETFDLDVRDSATSIQRAEYIQHCLGNIGISVTVHPMSWKDFLEYGYKGKSILCIKSWVSDNGDPDNFVFPLFHSKSRGEAGNTTFYANQQVDHLIETARSERSLKRRRLIYQEIERLICEDAPWIFLSHGVDTYAVSRLVNGFKVDPFGINRFRYIWKN